MIPVNTPDLTGNEKKYLNECIDTSWISSEGPFVKRFEKEMAEYVGRKEGVAVCNGTVALTLALKSIGIKKGDEVIIPNFTIISCAQAVIELGAKPVFVDAKDGTWNMDPSKIEEVVSSKTKAIMIVHIYGLPVEYDEIKKVADKYNLKIVEDAAEMHGQTYKGKKCGSLGDVSTFSFYPNKHITTGEGGMVLSDDQEVLDKAKYYRNLCFEKKRFVHNDLGWNYRMTNLQAALGVAQLERIDKFIERKREIGSYYLSRFKDMDIELPIKSTSYAENIFWVFGIVLKNKPVEDIVMKLGEKKIGTRPFFWPMSEQPVLAQMGLVESGKNYPVSMKLGENGFYLPSGLGISDDELKFVADSFIEVMNE